MVASAAGGREGRVYWTLSEVIPRSLGRWIKPDGMERGERRDGAVEKERERKGIGGYNDRR